MKLKILSSSSNANGYILESNDGILIIECGVKLIEVKKQLDFNISKIRGVILTHEHL